MQQDIAAFVQLHPRFQKLGIVIPSCAQGQGSIGVPGKDKLHVDTAPGGIAESFYRLGVGDKIRVRHVKRSFRKRDGGHIQDEREPVGLSRGTSDRPHQGVSLRFQIREIVPIGKVRALLRLPRVEKQFLEFGDNRAFDPDVRVTPGDRRLIIPFSPGTSALPGRRARIYRTDVDAPRKDDVAVDDQNLAMIRMRHAPVIRGSPAD